MGDNKSDGYNQKQNQRISDLKPNMKYQHCRRIQEEQHLNDSSEEFNIQNGYKAEKNFNNHKKIISNSLIYVKKQDGQYQILVRQQIKKTKAPHTKQYLKNSRKFQKKLNTAISQEFGTQNTQKLGSQHSPVTYNQECPNESSNSSPQCMQLAFHPLQIQACFGFPVFVNF